MITYLKGNLLEADAEALVNTVNTVGVMGKGIAKQFKDTFLFNFKVYEEASKKGEVKTGQMLVVKDQSLGVEKLIINFPTKTEWFRKSQYVFIEEGLKDLVKTIEKYNIQSIALPPLGCGNGGLKWDKVKALIEKYLGDIPISILVFEPNEHVKKILQKREISKEIKLTPARAMLLYALAKYEQLGETPTVFAANKIAYFLQESGEALRLNFVPYTYGPYAQAVDKVLFALNGRYIAGMEQMDAKPFESLQLKYENFQEVRDFIKNKLSSVQIERLDGVFKMIEGFESTLSLEILSSIHFLLGKNKNLKNIELLEQIQAWNDRKKSLIKEEYINIAVRHLNDYNSTLHFA